MDGENVRENSAWVDLIGVDGAAAAKEPENAPQNRQEEWYQYLGNAAELPEGGAQNRQEEWYEHIGGAAGVPEGGAQNRQEEWYAWLAENRGGGGSEYPDYTGETTVTPSRTAQTLATKDTVLRENIVVEAVPYTETPNAAGGVTAAIG